MSVILRSRHAIVISMGIKNRAIGRAKPPAVPQEVTGGASRIYVPVQCGPIRDCKYAWKVLVKEMADSLEEYRKIDLLQIAQECLQSLADRRSGISGHQFCKRRHLLGAGPEAEIVSDKEPVFQMVQTKPVCKQGRIQGN